MLKLTKKEGVLQGKVSLPISKSLFNRQLIIDAISNSKLAYDIPNLPDDCHLLLTALQENSDEINIGHAGTAMRFLTAYATLLKRKIHLSGSGRMHQRPIGILVKALNQIGASIQHIKDNDCPPLIINNSKPIGGDLSISGSISSQYISAILLIAPSLKNGLRLKIEAPLVSKPYLDMTLNLMARNGIEFERSGLEINIRPQAYQTVDDVVELDWSAASFFYQLVALNKGQGDAVLPKIFQKLGVSTETTNEGIWLEQNPHTTSFLQLDCTDFPDLSLPIAAACAGLGVSCLLQGLETLLIKETNRISALKIELEKFGLTVNTTDSSLAFKGVPLNKPTEPMQTYQDHRMAMCLAPLVSVVHELDINDPEVVSKSFPNYWEMLGQFVDIS